MKLGVSERDGNRFWLGYYRIQVIDYEHDLYYPEAIGGIVIDGIEVHSFATNLVWQDWDTIAAEWVRNLAEFVSGGLSDCYLIQDMDGNESTCESLTFFLVRRVGDECVFTSHLAFRGDFVSSSGQPESLSRCLCMARDRALKHLQERDLSTMWHCIVPLSAIIAYVDMINRDGLMVISPV